MKTIIQNPANSQNHNRYSYCLNNPLKYVDPSGYNYSCYIDGLKISYNTFRNYMNWMSSEQKELFEKFEYTRDPNNRSDFNFTIQNDDKTNTYYSKHNNSNGFWVEWDGQQKIPDNELLSLGFKLNSNYTYARYAQFFEFDLFDFSNKINQNYSQGSFPSNTIEQEQTNNRIIDLNKENVKSLNIFGAILGSTVALAYVSGGAEVGTFVNRTLSVPAVAISVVLTYDTWADYSLNKNKKRGDLVQATFGTIITIVGIVSWPAAVPACIYGIIDANGNLNKLWRYFDE